MVAAEGPVWYPEVLRRGGSRRRDEGTVDNAERRRDPNQFCEGRTIIKHEFKYGAETDEVIRAIATTDVLQVDAVDTAIL